MIENINDCANALLTLEFNDLMKLVMSNQLSIGEAKFSANNIENIETGISGYLLFLLEYYKFTENKDISLKIDILLGQLISYCNSSKTSNYSLFTGRGGLVYFILEYNDIKNDPKLLDDCVAIVTASKNSEYLESPYTSDNLYEGRAGYLLLLLKLYTLKPADELLQMIRDYTSKIFQNAILSDCGLSWNRSEEINIKDSCGFAFGVAGIAYVIQILERICIDPVISYYLKNSINYLDNCWNEEQQNWPNLEKDIFNVRSFKNYKKQYESNITAFLTLNLGDFSWSSGKSGILNTIIKDINEETFSKSTFESMNFNIFEGIAGVGLLILRQPLSNKKLLNEINHLLLSRLSPPSINGGLFFGQSGICYYMLKYINGDKESVCSPFQGIKPAINKVQLSLRSNDLLKSLLGEKYKRTISFFESIAPKEWEKFLEQQNSINILVGFRQFISKEIEDRESNREKDVLKDVFNLEQQKEQYSKNMTKYRIQLYFEKFIHNEKMIALLNNPDEWVYNQQIRISPDAIIVRTQWDWLIRENFNFKENLNNQPRNDEYIFLPCYNNYVQEYNLGIFGLLLHRFDESKSINEALVEVKAFFNSQHVSVIKQFSEAIGSSDVNDFIDRLDFLITHKAKQLLYDGILEFEKTC